MPGPSVSGLLSLQLLSVYFWFPFPFRIIFTRIYMYTESVVWNSESMTEDSNEFEFEWFIGINISFSIRIDGTMRTRR